MKIQWSVIFSLLLLATLVGCGGEQFGSSPQSTSSSADPLKNFSSSACSTFTLIKPKVDVVYVVDNSYSTFYVPADIKTGISNTVNLLSSDFDFRVIGTPLLETPSSNNDYEVLTNSTDLQGLPSDSRRVSSAGAFTFFSKSPIAGVEKGLDRVTKFIDFHKNNLLRPNAYLIIVLVSNGRDLEVEEDKGTGNGETIINTAVYNTRLSSFRSLKSSLNAIQLRMISLAPYSVCDAERRWRSALKSYVKMANQLYQDSQATDSSNQDSFDLCSTGNITSIFSSINSSIKQVLQPHKYRYWPITFAENNETVSLSEIKVHKVGTDGSSVELARNSDWVYEDKGYAQAVNTRELPTQGEPINGRHFIKFTNLLTYPDCVLVTSTSRTEYFQYIVLPQKPKPGTISVSINGNVISQSSSNGWSDETSAPQTKNIKAAFPAAGDENPPVVRTGFMLKLNGTSNYYKSGDTVKANYIPAGI